MRGLAFGVLGMTRKEFYEMRPGEFLEALAAHNEEVDADRKHLGELVRGATLRMFNLQVAQKNRYKDPAKFWPMPWDERKNTTEKEEIHRLEHLDEAGQQEEVQKFLSRISNGTGAESKD